MERVFKIRPLIISRFNLKKGDMAYRLFYGETYWAPDVAWYIEGADRNILVDTGISAAESAKYTATRVEDINLFEDALSSVGLRPEDIDLIIQTHLHFDHCANTAKCVNAKVYVQKAELDFAFAPHPVFAGAYDKNLIQGCRLVAIQGDQEIIPGIEVISVPGHSFGTQAVSIQTTRGRAIISGFCACNETFYPPTENFQGWGSGPVVAPGIFVNCIEAYDSVVKIKQMADIILPMHDNAIFDREIIP